MISHTNQTVQYLDVLHVTGDQYRPNMLNKMIT